MSDVEKLDAMLECDHAGMDPHRDERCPKCGVVQWYTSRTAAEAFKQDMWRSLFGRGGKYYE